MALINQDIKNFVVGISQQPATLRAPEQLEEQLNGYSSEATGLQKRPPTIFIKNLHQYATGGTQVHFANRPLVHFINRDAFEKYVVIFDGSDIAVYDLQGNRYTVNYKDEQTKQYILVQPREHLKALTIADYTFVLNNQAVAMMGSERYADWDSQGALINIKSGQYGRNYKIVINDVEVASYETPDGSQQSHIKNITTDYIATQLASGCRSAGWTVTQGPSWIYVYGQTINKLECYDGYNNQAMFGTLKTTQKFINLPASAPNGFTCKVTGEAGSTTDDYYVKYNEADGVWQECAQPGILKGYNNYTMPHALIRQADGTFLFTTVDWSERSIGDDESNPEPSFIGQKINDIFYFKNRLGFLSGENVILTRSADFFNFWMTSAMNVQDTDPIDLAVSDNTINTLYHAVSFDEELIIFSENAQFSLRSEGVLSPKTAVLTPPATHFSCSLSMRPVNAGRNIYFVTERSKYTTVREFFVAQDNTDSYDAQDITAHVPNYIPNGCYKCIASNTENILLFLSKGEENAIYVYKYLFIQGVRQQASWSKWTLSGDILGGEYIDGNLYLLEDVNGYLRLEKMSFTFNTNDINGEPYRVMLDSKTLYTIPDNAYDEENVETLIDIQDVFGSSFVVGKEYGCLTIEKSNSDIMTDEQYNIGMYAVTTNRYIRLAGDWHGKKVIVGQPYLFKMVLSTIYIKQQTDNGYEAMLDGRLQLRKIWFNHADSGYFKVDVECKDKNKYEYINSGYIIGTSKAIMGKTNFTTASFSVPIQSLNTNCVISLYSDKPQSVAIVGAGWIGNYNRRTRRI